jgi:hypothetical protein
MARSRLGDRGLEVDDARVNPSHHGIQQIDVLGPLLRGRSQTVQTDLIRDYTYIIQAISQKIGRVLEAFTATRHDLPSFPEKNISIDPPPTQ